MWPNKKASYYFLLKGFIKRQKKICLLLAALMMVGLVLYSWMIFTMYPAFWKNIFFLLCGFVVISVCYVFLVKVFMGKKIRYLIERYQQLDVREKLEPKRRYPKKLKGVVFGEKWLYFNSGGALFFYPYSDIIWAYEKNNTIPTNVMTPEQPMLNTVSEKSLILHMHDGMKYTVGTSGSVSSLLEELREYSSTIVIGFSKKRKAMFLNDPDSFYFSCQEENHCNQ